MPINSKNLTQVFWCEITLNKVVLRSAISGFDITHNNVVYPVNGILSKVGTVTTELKFRKDSINVSLNFRNEAVRDAVNSGNYRNSPCSVWKAFVNNDKLGTLVDVVLVKKGIVDKYSDPKSGVINLQITSVFNTLDYSNGIETDPVQHRENIAKGRYGSVVSTSRISNARINNGVANRRETTIPVNSIDKIFDYASKEFNNVTVGAQRAYTTVTKLPRRWFGLFGPRDEVKVHTPAVEGSAFAVDSGLLPLSIGYSQGALDPVVINAFNCSKEQFLEHKGFAGGKVIGNTPKDKEVISFTFALGSGTMRGFKVYSTLNGYAKNVAQSYASPRADFPLHVISGENFLTEFSFNRGNLTQRLTSNAPAGNPFHTFSTAEHIGIGQVICRISFVATQAVVDNPPEFAFISEGYDIPTLSAAGNYYSKVTTLISSYSTPATSQANKDRQIALAIESRTNKTNEVLLDYLTNKTYGFGIAVADIDLDSFNVNLSGHPIFPATLSGTTSSNNKIAVLKSMLDSCGLTIYETKGKVSLYVAETVAALDIAHTFFDESYDERSNCIVKQDIGRAVNIPNEIKAVFPLLVYPDSPVIDPFTTPNSTVTSLFTTRDENVLVDNEDYLKEDLGKENTKAFDLDFQTLFSNPEREVPESVTERIENLAVLFLNRARYGNQKVIIATDYYNARDVVLGQVVYVNSLKYGWIGGTATTGQYEIANAVLSTTSKRLTASTGVRAIEFAPDGLTLFAIYNGTDTLYAHRLTNAYDISTLNTGGANTRLTQDSTMTGMKFSPDGMVLLLTGSQNKRIYKYNLTTAFDLSTITYDSQLSITDLFSNPLGIEASPDGMKVFVGGSSRANVRGVITQYNLSTAWDISSATVGNTFNTQVQTTYRTITDVTFNNDGTKVFITDINSGSVWQYNLATAYDISTAVYETILINTAPQNRGYTALAFDSIGSKLFNASRGDNTIYQYDIPLSTGANNQDVRRYKIVKIQDDNKGGMTLTGTLFSNKILNGIDETPAAHALLNLNTESPTITTPTRDYIGRLLVALRGANSTVLQATLNDLEGVTEITYTWYRNNVIIEDEVSSTYQLINIDQDTNIHCISIFKFDGVKQTIISEEYQVVAPTVITPTISLVQNGLTLNISSSKPNPDEKHYIYRGSLLLLRTETLPLDIFYDGQEIEVIYTYGEIVVSAKITIKIDIPAVAIRHDTFTHTLTADFSEVTAIAGENPLIIEWVRDGRVTTSAEEYLLTIEDAGSTIVRRALYQGQENLRIPTVEFIPTTPEPTIEFNNEILEANANLHYPLAGQISYDWKQLKDTPIDTSLGTPVYADDAEGTNRSLTKGNRVWVTYADLSSNSAAGLLDNIRVGGTTFDLAGVLNPSYQMEIAISPNGRKAVVAPTPYNHDFIYELTLSIPGDLSTATVARFFNADELSPIKYLPGVTALFFVSNTDYYIGESSFFFRFRLGSSIILSSFQLPSLNRASATSNLPEIPTSYQGLNYDPQNIVNVSYRDGELYVINFRARSINTYALNIRGTATGHTILDYRTSSFAYRQPLDLSNRISSIDGIDVNADKTSMILTFSTGFVTSFREQYSITNGVIATASLIVKQRLEFSREKIQFTYQNKMLTVEYNSAPARVKQYDLTSQSTSLALADINAVWVKFRNVLTSVSTDEIYTYTLADQGKALSLEGIVRDSFANIRYDKVVRVSIPR